MSSCVHSTSQSEEEEQFKDALPLQSGHSQQSHIGIEEEEKTEESLSLSESEKRVVDDDDDDNMTVSSTSTESTPCILHPPPPSAMVMASVRRRKPRGLVNGPPTVTTTDQLNEDDDDDDVYHEKVEDEDDRVFVAEKVRQIEEALAALDEDNGEDDLDCLSVLRQLAVSDGGLLRDDLRLRAWPRLAQVPRQPTTPPPSDDEDDDSEREDDVTPSPSCRLPSQAECESHPEYMQVVLDVNRSLKRFPPGIAEAARPGLQDQLTRLIVRVLLQHPQLHYYQGYHDVAITFLLVVGEIDGFHIMHRLSGSHLRDFMAPTMEKTTFLLNYMYPIIEQRSPALHKFLDRSEVGTIFALPWVITWFGHVLPDYDDVVRLYDFFLAKPPLMAIYLAAAIVLHRQDELLGGQCECELASVHGLLSRIPHNIPFEKLLLDAQDLYDAHPPGQLEPRVQARFERLQQLQLVPRATSPDRSASTSKWSKANLPLAAGAILFLGAPIAVGLLAWKWYHSAAATGGAGDLGVVTNTA